MFDILKSAALTWQHLLPTQATLSASTTPEPEPDSELEKEIEAAREQYRQEREQELADAHAAAASGEGPQPWDADWIQYQRAGVEDEIWGLADSIGWHRTQQFIEILDWALASPQGQRALAVPDEATNPWQETLELIKEIRQPLVEASHGMLITRAEGLGYSGCLKDDLSDALEELVCRLYNIKRGED
jgi:hypothetical protein